jgi:16S rRNA (adenine1518-N6/adenine1519-N6)-dimethyltransferase|tara:strand:- start:322 stop:1086 length:765 start_codon:yes stop_codon:yes gene_type:complete
VHLKKKLGQHFLVDQNVINKLVRNISPNDKDIIVEIGPGDGAMTKSILPSVKKMYLIEKDTDLLNELVLTLHKYKNSKIINQDILKYDFSIFDNPFRVIGNLPYNISTEIIFKMCKINNIVDMHFMLQKEVVDRMVSKPNSKIYGRLSVMAQAYFKIEKLFDISENVFLPKPKVKSSFIRLLPRKSVFNNDVHEEVFSNVVKSSFEGRRKMIRKSLNKYLNDHDYNNINIDPKLRAENLTVGNYLHISNYVCQI